MSITPKNRSSTRRPKRSGSASAGEVLGGRAGAKPREQRRFEDLVSQGARQCGMRGTSVLCAVSGGADSTALAVALARRARALGLGQIAMAYVDHQLRASSAGDAVIVRKLSKLLGIPFFEARVSVESKGMGLEAAARAVRYLALQELALREGFDIVATGHTRTDQAETVLLRLLRGSGLRGLSAMASSRRLVSSNGPGGEIRLCRPLLALSGSQTRAYVASVGLRFAVDETNADRRILRNALRMEVWPALCRLEPGVEARLAQLASQCREDEAVLDSLARAAASSLIESHVRGVKLRAATVASLPTAVARRLVRRAISQLRPTAQPSSLHLRQLVALCVRGGAGELHVAGDLVGRLRKGTLTLEPRGLA